MVTWPRLCAEQSVPVRNENGTGRRLMAVPSASSCRERAILQARSQLQAVDEGLEQLQPRPALRLRSSQTGDKLMPMAQQIHSEGQAVE